MRLDRFTTLAQQALADAQSLATKRSHSEVTPLHLLVALASEKGGAMASLLQRAGADPARVLQVAEASLKSRPTVSGAGAPQAGRVLAEVLAKAE